jgi:tripartite-type tricarboxylate transporter receptor subunit TctC
LNFEGLTLVVGFSFILVSEGNVFVKYKIFHDHFLSNFGERTMKHLIPGLEFFFTIFCGIMILTLDVQAQPYPNRPIQMIIGQVPGAAGDITCRPLAEELGKILRVPVIVVNKPGDSGTLWNLYNPFGTPEEAKKILAPVIEKAIKDPAVKARIEKMGYIVDYKSPAELKKISTQDYETASAIAIKIGLHK